MQGGDVTMFQALPTSGATVNGVMTSVAMATMQQASPKSGTQLQFLHCVDLDAA